MTVVAKGTLRLDFAVEHAAWFEFESPDLAAAVSISTAAGGGTSLPSAAISEYNEPWQVRSTCHTTMLSHDHAVTRPCCHTTMLSHNQLMYLNTIYLKLTLQ